MTNEDIAINSFTSDPIFDIHCFYDDEDITNGGMTLYSGQTYFVQVYVNVDEKQDYNGKMSVHTSVGDLEAEIVYKTPLNISENNVNSFSIYPNPAKDFIIIKGNRLETISIYNSFGQKISNISTNENMLRISTTNYPDGVYTIKTSDGITQKVVISHDR